MLVLVGVIGIIAIFHVMISQFAVASGFYLPMAEGQALREGDQEWLAAIKKHSQFSSFSLLCLAPCPE